MNEHTSTPNEHVSTLIALTQIESAAFDILSMVEIEREHLRNLVEQERERKLWREREREHEPEN